MKLRPILDRCDFYRVLKCSKSLAKLHSSLDILLQIPVKPSLALEEKRPIVRELPSRFRAANPRVFGSVLHGTDREGSDLDMLVDTLPGATLFDIGGLQMELEELLGVPVDLLTPADLPASFRDQVLAEAVPV